MVNGTQIWQILRRKFGKFGSTVWGSVLVNFFAKCPATESFCLAKMFGEIYPSTFEGLLRSDFNTFESYNSRLRAKTGY